MYLNVFVIVQYFPEKLANSPSQFFVTFNTDTKEFYTGRAVTSTKVTTKVCSSILL